MTSATLELVLGQSLAFEQQPFIPSPAVVLPLSKSIGPNDLGPYKLTTSQSAIAYDNLYTPAGFIGSAMITKELNHKSFISVNPDVKMGIQSSLQLTLMGWIRKNGSPGGTVLVKDA